MNTTTVFSRVKTDFFAIFVPGAYVFSIILFVYLAITHEDANISISHRIESVFDELKDYWPLTLIIFIICYLIGILIRSFRVSIADELCKKIFSRFTRFKKGKWNITFYKSSFPYPAILEKLIQHLTESKLVKRIKLPDEEYLDSAYQFWKLSICSELPDVFSYTQTLESTVRLFAGMFWAGLLGIIGSIVILVARLSWWKLDLLLFSISLIISTIFGMNIRRVRGREVSYVFIAYLVLQKKK
ncbi:MAG: hypothetical protein GTO45_29400 [Candidatus Aminicenantes bacterium]|nr:hypothetical protein [Candidatus Aminicenantes bacterium]NIM82910.1 hypothetical protein [Candidatus Aminicenantes bacterium]NIN22286.1 hypothetical protein [Candidatus Aminicenantes bacterium]NIN46054.1 hypothetical protein [Candidatus Aminicenantes bacterium]NIN88890.1 hypothetical protein [Candidatus Aminicenantes bacterium]